MEAERALHGWDALMAAGDDYGITPCGILAMDMARVEAGLFMVDADYTAANHAWIEGQKSSPLEMGLDWTVNLNKKATLSAAERWSGKRKQARRGSWWGSRLIGWRLKACLQRSVCHRKSLTWRCGRACLCWRKANR